MADNDGPQSDGSGRHDNEGDDHDRGHEQQPFNPFGMLFGAPSGGSGQQPDLEAMMRQMQDMFAQFGGQMGTMFGAPAGGQAHESWETVRDLARKVVQSKGADPTPTHQSRRQLGDAARIVDSWLDRHVEFPATGGRVQAWSRAEWVENTMPTWRRLIDPVASALAEAMAGLASSGGDDAANPMAGLEAMIQPMLRHSGSAVFHAQAADALGQLATSVVSATESTLPLDGDHAHTIALLPTNVAEFSDGLEQDTTDIWLVLTLRESARQRLFAAAPWLSERLLSLVERYARNIVIDTSGIEEAMRDLESMTDLSQMEDLSRSLHGRLFAPKRTPEQEQVLSELETLLALIDGWVDEVTADVTKQWMPNAAPIVETLRRRRASVGPTEAIFKALVGLELRPRRVRDAQNLWAALRENGGAERREGPWAHPDLLPQTSDLDDPLGFVEADATTRATSDTGGDTFDEELRKLLDGDDQ